MNLGQGPPAAAHRVENRRSKRWAQIILHQPVDPLLGLRNAFLQQRLDRQGAQRQARPVVANMVVQGLGDLEAAASHVADKTDGTKKAGNDAER